MHMFLAAYEFRRNNQNRTQPDRNRASDGVDHKQTAHVCFNQIRVAFWHTECWLCVYAVKTFPGFECLRKLTSAQLRVRFVVRCGDVICAIRPITLEIETHTHKFVCARIQLRDVCARLCKLRACALLSVSVHFDPDNVRAHVYTLNTIVLLCNAKQNQNYCRINYHCVCVCVSD